MMEYLRLTIALLGLTSFASMFLGTAIAVLFFPSLIINVLLSSTLIFIFCVIVQDIIDKTD